MVTKIIFFECLVGDSVHTVGQPAGHELRHYSLIQRRSLCDGLNRMVVRCLECRQAEQSSLPAFCAVIPQGPGNIPAVGPFQTLL